VQFEIATGSPCPTASCLRTTDPGKKDDILSADEATGSIVLVVNRIGFAVVVFLNPEMVQ
jgi:hypothetical protein